MTDIFWENIPSIEAYEPWLVPWVWINKIIESIKDAVKNPDIAQSFQYLAELMSDKEWSMKLDGKNLTRRVALPTYLWLLSEFIIKWVYTGNVFHTFSDPRNRENFDNLTQYHESALQKLFWREGEVIDRVKAIVYRNTLPPLYLNYAISCIYREDFENALRYIERGFRISIQTGARIFALKCIIVFLDLLRVMPQNSWNLESFAQRGSEIFEHMKQVCWFDESTSQDSYFPSEKTAKDEKLQCAQTELKSQLYIAYFLQSPDVSRKGMAQLVYRDTDPEDSMRFWLGRIYMNANGFNNVDEVMDFLDKHGKDDRFLIVVPWLVVLLEAELGKIENTQDESERWKMRTRIQQIMVYIYRYIMRQEKRSVLMGLSWYQKYISLLKQYYSKKGHNISSVSDESIIGLVQATETELNDSFLAKYSKYFPLFFSLPNGNKNRSVYQYTENGIKEVFGQDIPVEMQEVRLNSIVWKVSGNNLSANENLSQLVQWFTPFLRQFVISKLSSHLSSEMKDWLGGVMAMDQHHADELRNAHSEALKLVEELRNQLVRATWESNSWSDNVIEGTLWKLGDVLGKIPEVAGNLEARVDDLRVMLDRIKYELQTLGASLGPLS